MKDQPLNFYLNEHSIEIVNKLSSINKNFEKILVNLQKRESIIKNKQKENIFEKVIIDVRTRE